MLVHLERIIKMYISHDKIHYYMTQSWWLMFVGHVSQDCVSTCSPGSQVLCYCDSVCAQSCWLSIAFFSAVTCRPIAK
jgi:hypothetical protein